MSSFIRSSSGLKSASNIPVRETITLTCSASGLGTIIYSWERNSGRNWTTVSNDNTTSYTTDATLAIGQYMYRCRVSNEAGSVVVWQADQ